MVTPIPDAEQVRAKCGARLTLRNSPPFRVHAVYVCALEPHDWGAMHQAADGTSWRASDFPPTGPAAQHVCAQRYVSRVDPQQSYVCSRLEGHYAEPHHDHVAGVSWSRAGDPRSTYGAAGIGARDAAQEHAQNCEAALLRIAERARRALDVTEPPGAVMATYGQALMMIIAECERGDR